MYNDATAVMKENKSLTFFIWDFIRPHKFVFLCVTLISTCWALDATIWPYLIGKIIDVLTEHEASRSLVWKTLLPWVIQVLGLWIFIELIFRIQGYLLIYFFPKIESAIRMKMFDHVQRHSPRYFNDRFAGGLANKITDMTTQVVQALSMIFWTFIPPTASVLVGFFFLFKISPIFAAIFALLMVVYAGIAFYFTIHCQTYEHEHSESRSLLLGKVVDTLSNNLAVNLFHRFCFERSYLAQFQKEEYAKNIVARKYAEKMRAALSLTFLIGGISINALMLSDWQKGAISTGETVQMFNMFWNIVMLLWTAGIELPAFFQSIGVMKQAFELMQDPQDIQDPKQAFPLKVSKGEIVFENVSFSYGKKPLFQNEHIVIQGGEKVGLVGYSGSGKSTFVNLILRFYALQKGRILIDNQNIADVTLESLRSQIALIPQDPILFHRSLEENIRYGRIEASLEEVQQAAKLAHCEEFILKTSLGYKTLVGERGTKLSGGERQRLAVARAILSNAPILILDEATSALDSVTEQYIQSSLSRLMENRTTLVIAHRLSTLAQMDRVLVFNEGSIVEQGSHHSLIESEGLYARLWQMQAGGFLPRALEEDEVEVP